MLTLESLDKLLADQSGILIDLNISIKNMYRLHEDVRAFEADIKRHGFFLHYFSQLKFVTVVQLSKLYGRGPNDKRSFHKLLDTLRDSPYDEGLKEMLREHRVKFCEARDSHPDLPSEGNFARWIETKHNLDDVKDLFTSREGIAKAVKKCESNLDKPDIKAIIEKVLMARNQIYAHKDPSPSFDPIEMDELRLLIELAGELLNRFNRGFYGVTTVFSGVSGWEVGAILAELSTLREIRKR